MPGRRTRSTAELTNRKVRRSYHTAMGQQKRHSNSSFWKMRQGSGPRREDARWNNQTQYQRADERGMGLSVTNTERKSVNLPSGSFKTYNIRGKWGIQERPLWTQRKEHARAVKHEENKHCVVQCESGFHGVHLSKVWGKGFRREKLYYQMMQEYTQKEQWWQSH